jgi:hypothetical protein
MVYFVFDLDSTLADIAPVYFYIELLVRLESISQTMGRAAYKHFLDVILERESSLRNPLYILRPRILGIFTEIYGLKQMRRCEGVVIYSNNGYLPCLEFIRDLIEQFIGARGLICSCVYLRDRSRKDTPRKTWRDLKDILVDRCGADPSIDPESVVFFDDLPDHDLRNQLPPENYIHVEAYNYRRTDESLSYIKAAFVEAIQACGIIDQPVLFSNYTKSIRSLYKISGNTSNNKTNTFKTVFSMIDDDAKRIPERLEKPALNDAILMDVMNRYYNGPMAPTITVPGIQAENAVSPGSPVSPGLSGVMNNLDTDSPLANPFQTGHLGGSRTNRKRRNKTLRKRRYSQKNRTYNRRN